ncbi:hypothetical protein V8G54_033026 [Vigna mungo]|uniref:Uncharacterized protein n=1 Tax=Vigna mungo TaxID=3915 RepID=A0AAQ3MN94_VIGMU
MSESETGMSTTASVPVTPDTLTDRRSHRCMWTRCRTSVTRSSWLDASACRAKATPASPISRWCFTAQCFSHSKGNTDETFFLRFCQRYVLHFSHIFFSFSE